MNASEFIVEGTTSTSETATRGAYRTLYGAETSVLAEQVKVTIDALIARPEVSLVEVSPVVRRGIFGHVIKGEPVAILARMLDGGFSIVWAASSPVLGQLAGFTGYRSLVVETDAELRARHKAAAGPFSHLDSEHDRVITNFEHPEGWSRAKAGEWRGLSGVLRQAGVAAWDLYVHELQCLYMVYVDAAADGPLVARWLARARPWGMATKGAEGHVVNEADMPEHIHFSRLPGNP